MSSIIIGGDYYIADIHWDKCSTTTPSTATDHGYFLMFQLENSLSQLDKVVTWPLSNSILDSLTTTNQNQDNIIDTRIGISDHLLATFDICLSTMYQAKPRRKLSHFLIADNNNRISKVLNFTLEQGCPSFYYNGPHCHLKYFNVPQNLLNFMKNGYIKQNY